ncbi:UvrD-helicase domain-containing protein [Streptomyces hoynatensis]|uniref:DNA 3'-5' helicase n=1 Tax=Streptomyces hoynatensis TaxID=1141874 RepID=A0A3A9Z127_9ACTN|nr:UvrD-helicase domain-containing protein [Streptomyces hoynatensis]RKN41654.1 AAA family ATPase [Streptomyces hoynatensis]
MRFHADLHIHSKFSRACSKDCDLEHLAWWARRKGIALVGTGDFTHPAWFAHLTETLVEAGPGVFRLREELDREVTRRLPPSLAERPVRFLLSVEISTIYKRGDRTRKVHHLVYMPDFASAAEFNRRLARIGNIASDGRPILGLDSRDLLETALESSPDAFLIPAHVWTPWFAVLGSKSGFDRIEDCYADLSDHIFAVETGLSSDPDMNWRISALDRYRLVSNSDAHSPPMLGRETTLFDTELDYFSVRHALQTGEGHAGTVEFFPEEGKYHVDGHRKCGVRLEPEETRALGGRCPECAKPLTVGVLSRVQELADRPEPVRPAGAAGFHSLVPLPEIVGEIAGVGPKSKRVAAEVERLTTALGPELSILQDVPVDAIEPHAPLVGEAVSRLRRGEVIREAGYDGEYGVIRLFQPGELKRLTVHAAPALFDDGLFEVPPSGDGRDSGRPARGGSAADGRSGAARPGVPAQRPTPAAERGGAAPDAEEPNAAGPDVAAPGTAGPNAAEPNAAGPDVAGAGGGRDGLPGAEGGAGGDRPAGPVPGLDPDQGAAAEVTHGPLLIIAGPGTGKTRTLTHRIARLVTVHGVPPEQCLAITFTRRAAQEMAERLADLAPAHAPRLTIATFHSLGLRILREQHERAGLPAGFALTEESEPDRHARGLVSLDDLIDLPLALLEADPGLAAAYRDRWRWVSVDEYQDVDERQYRLLRQLATPEGNLTAIGDPDQAIYRFRGADVRFFLRFQADFPTARTVRLTRNYRSSARILTAAQRVVAPTTLVPDRVLLPLGDHGEAPVEVHAARGEQAEATFVARTVEQLIGGASFHARDSGWVETEGAQGLGFADIAVLYRTDRQSRAVAEALTRAGLPFQKRSHDRLADRPGVARLLGALVGAAEGGEGGEAGRAEEGPLPGRLRRALARLLDADAEAAAPGEEQVTEAELRLAADLLAPLAERCGEDLAAFRDELALGVEVDSWDPRADRISLLTLHAAKGLEFPVVFIVGCEDGLLPMRWPGSDPGEAAEEEAEERRLLFVGITRAQRHLYLSHAAERFRQGAVRPARRSPFLDALPAEVLRAETRLPRQRPARDTQLRLL